MNDLISRAAACACIGKMIKEYREKGEDDLADGMILARRYGIKRLPNIDAAPVVHGQWVADSDGLPVCSVCDEIAMQRLHCDTLHRTWQFDVRLVKTPYCPNCGANMKGCATDEPRTGN